MSKSTNFFSAFPKSMRKKNKAPLALNVEPNAALSPNFRDTYEVQEQVIIPQRSNKQLDDLMNDMAEEETELQPVSSPSFFQILGARNLVVRKDEEVKDTFLDSNIFRWLCLACLFISAAGTGVLVVFIFG